MRKYTALLLLPLTFLYDKNSHAMDQEALDTDKIYLVHVSSVMAKEATKIAGSKRTFVYNSPTNKSPSFLDEGKNIRTRFTLHYTLGGMVPSCSHVLKEIP